MLENYCGTLAHKTNHSFVANAEFVVFDHPRLGLLPCVLSTHDIEAGEEIFVHYGYNLYNCPEWYEKAWQDGNYPIPDSMKDCFGGNGNGSSSSSEGEEESANAQTAAEGEKAEEQRKNGILKEG